MALLEHLGWIVGGVIVLLGVVLGLPDLLRLSPRRVWAISSVAFSESIRRRVLWITPLAMIGILVVAQFLDPVDPADAIRQTTKVCLFATGLVVTVLAIILACTNLPKEIDSRVIYTIVTMPTTRLEIVFGKVLGFARVSGTVLLIMGLFTLAYLQVRAWRAESWVHEQAAVNPNDASLQNLARTRLLATRSLAEPHALSILGRPPVDAPPSLTGGLSQYFLVPFELSAKEKEDVLGAVNAGGGLMILNTIGYEQRVPTPEEQKNIRDLRVPTTETDPGWAGGAAGGGTGGGVLPTLPSALSVPLPIPRIELHLFDKNMNPLVDESGKDKPINNGDPVVLPPNGSKPMPAPAFLSAQAIEKIINADRFYVSVEVTTPTVTYVIGEMPTVLAYLTGPGQDPKKIEPAPSPDDPKRVSEPLFQSHRGKYGMQIKGRADGKGGVAAFTFRNVDVPEVTPDGQATLETRVGIESATDFETEANIVPRMSLTVFNRASRKTSPPVQVAFESGRITPTHVPVEYFRGGNFDVFLTGLNEGMWYSAEEGGVAVVRAQRSFALNLAKSMLIIWLMAVLVVVVAVFTSTFLSWPIAVVLTVVILLGHWGVDQLGDATGSGIGQEVTQGMGLDDPTTARIVRTSVGALTSALNFISAFLPDLSRFNATDHIERGVSIPASTVADAVKVLVGYGLPMTLLAYLILRKKEVAP